MSLQSSFEHNQSFPRMGKQEKKKVSSLLKGMMKFTGDELNSCTYTPDLLANSFDLSHSLNGSLHEDTRPDSSLSGGKYSRKSPYENLDVVGCYSKMVLTIDSNTSMVLTANRQACRFFGYSSKELIGMRMNQLFKGTGSYAKEALMHDVCKTQGDVVVTCGKVMDAVTAAGKEVPVSLWLKKVESSSEKPRCIAVLQSVVRVIAEFSFNSTGEIVECDDNFNLIHGSIGSLTGSNLLRHMPCYQLPQPGKRMEKETRKQRTTCVSVDGQSFPVSVYIQSHEKLSDSDVKYVASLWYYTSIRGLISVSGLGKIEAVNNNFSLATLGYRTDELTAMNIEDLLADVFVQPTAEDHSSSELPPPNAPNAQEEHSTTSSPEQKNDRPASPESAMMTRTPARRNNPAPVSPAPTPVSDSWVELSMSSSSCMDKINALLNGSMALTKDCSTDSAVHLFCEPAPPCDPAVDLSYESVPPSDRRDSVRPPVDGASPLSDYQSEENGFCAKKFTSTPFVERASSRVALPLREGRFEGHARHKNGTFIDVRYEVLAVKGQYYVWLSLKSNEHWSFTSSVLCSSFNSTLPSLNASAVSGMLDFSLGTAIKQEARANDNQSLDTSEERLAIEGGFGAKYELLKRLGNGAFGFVQLAKRKSDEKKFVVKFIRVEKVLEECWVDDFESNSRIPLEVSLLCSLSHRNIVSVVEFFETRHFFSMVMPLHGEVDLFEFIDRSPLLTEYLASYIYRQIVSGVKYLHDRGIVHRDIKDENVIIDERFHCRLIDFGSAAYYKPGKLFATFCGTIEYCAPEVLLGNRYEGPELDMWALGVTLYTLVFGENPFSTMEESIDAELKPPTVLSKGLMFTIRWLLQPVPEHRCSMSELVEQDWINIPVKPGQFTWSEVFPGSAKQEAPSIAENDENSCGPPSPDGGAGLAKDALVKRQLDDHLAPLTRRLENFNLNHSI